jgi:hypothetical protein
MVDKARRPTCLIAVALVALALAATWQALRVAPVAGGAELGGSGLGGMSLGSPVGVWCGPSTGDARLRSPLLGSWRERGGSHVAMALASDGIATFTCSLHGSPVWLQHGGFRLDRNGIVVTCVLIGSVPRGYRGMTCLARFDLSHGCLLWPADDADFSRG